MSNPQQLLIEKSQIYNICVLVRLLSNRFSYKNTLLVHISVRGGIGLEFYDNLHLHFDSTVLTLQKCCLFDAN